MSDLSRLLGDVYGTGADADLLPPPPRDEAPAPAPATPEWAEDSVLDEAFADWVPGPPTDAPAAERAALSDLASFDADAPVADQPPATLAEALPVEAEWFFEVPPATEVEAPTVLDLPAVEEEHPETVVVPWQRADDDLLPAKGRRRRRRR